MSDDPPKQPPVPPGLGNPWTDLLLKATPALGGLLTVIWLFSKIGKVETGLGGLASLGKFGAAVAIAFGVAALLRYAVKPMLPAEPAPPGPSAATMEATRDKLGPIVLGIGTAAIAILAVALIIAFYQLAAINAPNNPVMGKIDSLLMGVFTAVLPVFATWVGTVLAFYFTKESFRQAAQSALEASQGAKPPVLAIDRMIPYANIGKITVANEAEARGTTMKEVFAKFNDQTTMCLMFTQKQVPLFILRNKTPPMPSDWNKETFKNDEQTKVAAYLAANNKANEANATKFDFLPRTATLDAARTKMATMDGDDLFITETGDKAEPVLGWIPRDKLK
jgi:hypothetical protein